MKKFSIKSLIATFGVVIGVAVMAAFASAAPASAQISTNARNLAGLIAVSNISGDGSGTLGSGNNSLADLIVLSGLFPTSTNASTNAKDLAALIAVTNAVGDNGTLSSGNNSLASLIVLNNLFLDP